MSYPNAIRVAFEPIRTVAAEDFSQNYFPVGDPFMNPIRCIYMANPTNVQVMVSFDGVTDHVFIDAYSYVIFDYESNKEMPAGKLTQSRGTQAYARVVSGAISGGNFWLTAFYGYST